MVSHVTANGWYVSCTTPPGRLSVTRYPFWAQNKTYSRPARGDADGKIFGDADYTRFCVERGYLQPYVNAERSVFKKLNRDFIRYSMTDGDRMIKSAVSYRELVDIADWFKARMLRAGADHITGCAFFNGIMCLARKRRPDLVLMR